MGRSGRGAGIVRALHDRLPRAAVTGFSLPAAQIAAGFGISVGTAHAYTIALLVGQAPGLLKVLCEREPEYVLLDGTLAECDRMGDGKAHYSHKRRRHGVNVQVVTDPGGQVLWISPALPGRCHDLTAARTHRIVRICERQGVPILADRAYTGAGPWVTAGRRGPPGGELTPTERMVNRHWPRPEDPSNAGWQASSPGESSEDLDAARIE